MLKPIIRFLLGLLIFILIIDPGDLIFHLKIPLFILIFVIWFLLKTLNPIKINNDILIIIFIFLIIPFLGILSAVAQNNFSNAAFAIGLVKSFSIIVLLIVIMDLKIPVDIYLIKYSFIIPLIIIPIYIFLVLNPMNVLVVFNYLSDKDVAKFSNRDFYGYNVVMLYYRTSPLLVFPLAYFCNKFTFGPNKLFSFIMAILFFFTLMLSGTRANMLSGVFIMVYFLFVYLNNKRNKFPLILGLFLVLFGFMYFINTLSFDKPDKSAQIKSGHFDSYMFLFNEHPLYLVWGEGLGSVFYSSGNGGFVIQTELTYLDLIRWFGIPITLLLVLLLIYPIIFLSFNKRINENNKYTIIAYLGYLFIVGTNPLLISSTGMLIIIVMYSLMEKNFTKGLDAQYNSYQLLNIS